MSSRLNFSLSQLEYLLAVYTHRSMAEAAKKLGVTQPNLTIQIRKLEEVLGLSLIDRNQKPVKLTNAGQALLPVITQIVEQAHHLAQKSQMLSHEVQLTRVRVGIIPTVGAWFIDRIKPFLRRRQRGKQKPYTTVQFAFQELETIRILEGLDRGHIDWGIVATPIEGINLHYRPIFEEPFYVVLSKEHRLSKMKNVDLESLQSDPLWLLPDDHCLKQQVLDLCKGRFKTGLPFLSWEAASFEGILYLIRKFGGYTVVPEIYAKQIIETHGHFVIKPLKIPAFRQIGLVYVPPARHAWIMEEFLTEFRRYYYKTRVQKSVVPVRLNLSSTSGFG